MKYGEIIMTDKWYYVLAGDRKGPVEFSQMTDLISAGTIGDDDYIWKKGFENWVQLKEVPEFDQVGSALPEVIEEGYSLNQIAGNENCIFIKIGADRGATEVEYGPYSIDLIKKLFDENRVNGKTHAFVKGMSNWIMLGEFTDFQDIFEDLPPPIADEDRRSSLRKPLVARMYIENNKKVYVGLCRDISVGGMQVLVDHFPGASGDRIAINVHPENDDYHFVASGEIVRVLEGGQGFSFRFNDLSQESLGAIENYVEHA